MKSASNADEIRFYISELLSKDYEEHSRPEIFDYVLDTSESNYTQGMLSGALKSLVDAKKGIECTRRGWYRCVPINPDENLLLSKVLRILQEAKSQLDDACTLNLLLASKEDLNIIDKISKLIPALNETINSIKNN